MQILQRDMELLKLVGRFGQLSTPQLRTLVFPTQRSRTPLDHTLARLEKNGLLARVEQRMPGGVGGGSNVNVFQLGPQGWPLFNTGRRKSSRVVRAHSLVIADVYISLVEASRDKRLRIENYATEPDSHLELGGALLKPDLYADLVWRLPDNNGFELPVWLEIDMGTERQRQVLDQVYAYKLAYQSKHLYPLRKFPHVIFLATDAERAREIEYWIKRAGELPDMFRVGTTDQLLDILQGLTPPA